MKKESVISAEDQTVRADVSFWKQKRFKIGVKIYLYFSVPSMGAGGLVTKHLPLFSMWEGSDSPLRVPSFPIFRATRKSIVFPVFTSLHYIAKFPWLLMMM